MLTGNKNLKDSRNSIKDTTSMPAPYQTAGLGVGSYTKTHKLITALYMVTDIIDKDEPLRIKLRTLGTGIISDINSLPQNARGKISEIMSFLDIASAVYIVSEMNCNILKKEFLELNNSIEKSFGGDAVINKQINLSEFFREELADLYPASPSIRGRSKERVFGGNLNSKGHARIGVQKGSTLMKALSEIKMSDTKLSYTKVDSFDILKKQRREDIINFLRKKEGDATITDIKNGAEGLPAGRQGALVSCGEKTLQRELVSMVKDGVLNKTGEKRWSRYMLK